jgi:oligopeptide/dipeptide ABC transporter ATP-binding protein
MRRVEDAASAVAESAAAIAAVEDLKVHFRRGAGKPPLKAVDGVSFELHADETFAIIGESGSGKSTLARAFVQLQPRTSGRILLSGKDPVLQSAEELRLLRRDFQIVFQDPRASLNPRMRVGAIIAEPLEIQRIGTSRERQDTVHGLLERVELGAAYADRYPHQLSGGQRQRVNIARALAVRPKILVCDEVVAALDVSIQAGILNLFKDLQEQFGLTYVFITHDLAATAYVATRIAVMYLGVFVEMGSKEQVTHRPLHPYTRALLETAPEPTPSYRRRPWVPLKGEIPSAIAPPSGCRFRTRCPIAVERCAELVPQWRELRPGHFVACHLAAAEPRTEDDPC